MRAAETIYGEYAAVYDAAGLGAFGAHMAHLTLRWLAARGAAPHAVLDLACGTGPGALTFAEAGCRVVGVDRSAAMLEIARARARDADAGVTFVEGDICELFAGDHRPPTIDDGRMESTGPPAGGCGRPAVVGRPSSFDLVICFADSLNYLTGDEDLGRVFAGAAAALAEGGRLVFDVNAEAEYRTWDDLDRVSCDGPDVLVYNQLSFQPSSGLATGRIVWFVREIDRWWRGEETHVQRAWTDEEITAALAGAGFVLEARLDVEGRPAAPDARRVVYAAAKSGGASGGNADFR